MGLAPGLWPLSRKSYPKQFARLIGENSLFQAAARRLQGAGYGAPMVLTNSDFRFIVTEQLAEIGIDPGSDPDRTSRAATPRLPCWLLPCGWKRPIPMR